MPKKPSETDNNKIQSIKAEISKTLSRIRKSSLATLEDQMKVGECLIQLKEALPHGKFNSTVKEEFGISKQWAARLMKLSKSKSEFYAAMRQYEANGRLLPSEYLSVDGALTLSQDLKKEAGTDANDTPKPNAKTTNTKAEIQAELEELQQKLRISEERLIDSQQHAAEAADLRWQMAEKEKNEEALKLELVEKNALLAEKDAKIKELETKIASLSLKREAEHKIIRLRQLVEE